MPTIKELVVKFKADLRDVDTGLQNLNKKVEQSTNDLKNKYGAVSEKMRNVGLGLTAAITAPAMLVGKSMLEAGMNAVESENLFEVSMGGMARQARKWSEDMGKSLGLNRYAIRENVATFNVMFGSMGLGAQKAYELSTGLTKLAYDMASFYNLKPEEAFEKLRSGISGEVEPLRQLGISVTEATVQTYAYTHGIAKQGEQLTEQQKILARYGVIMDATSKAQGDLARTAESPVNQLRRMKEQASEVSIQFGQAMIPAFQSALGWVSKLVAWLTSLTDTQKQWLLVIGVVAAVVGPAILAISQLASAFVAVTTAMGTFAIIKNALSGPAGWAILATGVVVATAGIIALKSAIDSANQSMTTETDATNKATEALQKYGKAGAEAARQKAAQKVARLSGDASRAWEDVQKKDKNVRDTEWGVDGMFGGHARAEDEAKDARTKYDNRWNELQKARQELNALKSAIGAAPAPTLSGVPATMTPTSLPANSASASNAQTVDELRSQNDKLQTMIDQQQQMIRQLKTSGTVGLNAA